MLIEVISIGSEILKGSICDTNFQFIAQKFLEHGYKIFQHHTVSDHEKEIKEVFLRSYGRSDLVIVMGGLGPTLDDKTKYAICSALSEKLEFNSAYFEMLITRYGKEYPSFKEQSFLPTSCTLLSNTLGTAAGILFEKKNKKVVLVPGVPSEMKEMISSEILPILKRSDKEGKTKSFLRVCMVHLKEMELNQTLEELSSLSANLEVGVYPGYGIVRAEFAGEVSELEICQLKMKERFSSYIYSFSDVSLPKAIYEIMTKNKKTLALAESCTGGGVSSKIVSISGASEYFLGSIIAYSNFLKSSVLGVKKESLNKYGAVSNQVAREMAEGALKVTNADYAISITGVAGPLGGSKDKPVGLAFCSLAIRGGRSFVWNIQATATGKREIVIEFFENFILGALYRYIAHQINP